MVKTQPTVKSPRKAAATSSRPTGTVKTSASGNIRVVVRVRPPNSRESGDNFRNVIKIVDQHTMIFDPKEDDEPFFYHGVQQRNWDITKRANKHLSFAFDKIFGFDTKNLDIFDDSTKSLIDNIMKGYNCSAFVYGATGAGKTHTMTGSLNDPGITFRTVTKLFEQMEELSKERDFEIGMSYLEVYNENVQDLLNPGPALQLRENGKYGVFVSGLEVHRIDSSDKLFELLEKGNRNRTQHPTDSNAESSRSHAVFQVYLTMKMKASGEVRGAKLSMIDLAGSERGAATGYTGDRFTEGANINKSLLALGNCINSLAAGQKHVPYRDSKLTRLLKDSLGGNCRTVMITNVSPSSASYEDTYNTLKYALRAKKIKSNIIKNVVNSEANVTHYIKENEELKKEIEELKLQLALFTTQAPSQTQTGCVVEMQPAIPVVDEKLSKEFLAYYQQKVQCEEQIMQYESLDDIVMLRRELKEDWNTRVSGIATNSVEKRSGHQRFEKSVNNLDRQATTLKKDVLLLKEQRDRINDKIKEASESNPGLQLIVEREEARLNAIVSSKKNEHLEKICEVQRKDLRLHGQVVEQCCKILRPCFMQLRGFGHATDELIAEYQSLMDKLHGIRSVTWDEETGDTRTCLPTTVESDTIMTPTSSDLSCTILVEPKSEVKEDINMDSTFVVPKSKPPLTKAVLSKVCTTTAKKDVLTNLNSTCTLISPKRQPVSAKNLMVKLYKASPPKKRLLKHLPKNKENKCASRPFQFPTVIRSSSVRATKVIHSTSASRPPAPMRK